MLTFVLALLAGLVALAALHAIGYGVGRLIRSLAPPTVKQRFYPWPSSNDYDVPGYWHELGWMGLTVHGTALLLAVPIFALPLGYFIVSALKGGGR